MGCRSRWRSARFPDVYNGAPDWQGRLRPLDFARDDAAYVKSARYRGDLDYWRERFATVPAPLFPPRGPEARGAGRNFAPAVTWQMPWSQFHDLAAIGKARGTTPFAIMLALLGVTPRACGAGPTS